MTDFAIGAVADLTGIPVHTLRKWESRYAVVTPERSPTGRRRYTHAQVQRLKLVRTLAAAGHTLAHLASLSDGTLAELAGQHAIAAEKERQQQAPGVRIIGTTLPALCARHFGQERSMHSELVAAERWLATANPGEETLVLEMPTPSQDAIAQAAALSEHHIGQIVIAYAYASRSSLRTLAKAGITTVRLTAALPMIHSLLERDPAPLNTKGQQQRPPHRFDEAQLTAIAGMSAELQCECPNHIAELLLNISAFEAYSVACEQNEPDDQAVHQHLANITAQARALFEDALVAVAAADGLSLPAATPKGSSQDS